MFKQENKIILPSIQSFLSSAKTCFSVIFLVILGPVSLVDDGFLKVILGFSVIFLDILGPGSLVGADFLKVILSLGSVEKGQKLINQSNTGSLVKLSGFFLTQDIP